MAPKKTTVELTQSEKEKEELAAKQAVQDERMDAVYRALNFEEQCFLIDNLEYVQKSNILKEGAASPITHLVRIDGSPYEVIIL